MAGRVRIGKKKKNPSGFFSGISSAFSELILIILLFADGLLSYLAKKFARYCKLPVPCPLCSQLDGVIGDSKPVPFRDSLCQVHKSEISSLALCSSHHRLADAHSMCDACLGEFLQKLSPSRNNGAATTSPSPFLRCCSCCSVPFKDRPLAPTLIQAQKPIEPLLAPSASHLCEKPSRELTVYQDGCSKVKITSATDNLTANINLAGAATDNLKGGFVSRGPQTPPTTDFSENITRGITDDMVSERLAIPSLVIPDHQASLTAVERKHDIGVSSSSTGSNGGSEEMNLSQVENPSEVTSEQLPPKGLNIKTHAREVDVANGDARKSFGSTDTNFKTSQIMNAKLAPGIRPSLPSSASSDLTAERESYRVPEDLKVRLSQISSNRWPEFPGNDATSNPQVNGQGDEPRLSDASSSNGILNHIKRYNVDRYESGLDSLDGSIAGDVEGESAVDMDIKSLRLLYKELEEERNASAIAANQAMAMITRLQEEKAAMQMEASQYLRMMEEQSEYDQEALQKLNDLLVDREMEIQDLQAEIDDYRKQFGCEPLGDCEEREYREYTPRSHEIESNLEKNTIADFEDEKIYISEYLKRLQKKLQMFSNSKLSFGGSELDVKEDGFLDKSSLLEENDTRNCEYVKQPFADSDQEISQWNGTLKNNQERESMISKDSSPSKEDSSIIKCFTPSSTQDLEFSSEETLKESILHSISGDEKQLQMGSRGNDITALEKEIAQLSARLEALEVDKSFLDHVVDLLKNGCDGLQFIQEIASQLRELRKIGITIHQEQIINA